MSTARGLVTNWSFEASSAPAWVRRDTLIAWAFRSTLRPASRVLRAMSPARRWVVYFLYVPDGALLSHHLFTLRRLREQGLAVCVVCACRQARHVPAELHGLADALVWKHLRGFDFSAYGLALRLIARASPGARVLLLNDSVYGPFTDLRPFIERAPWELTAFTASSQLQNHVQSYALILREVTPRTVRALRTVLPAALCLQRFDDVVVGQELRLARVASASLSVGSFWYAPRQLNLNPTLNRPFELLAAGHPFLKRSLLGKHAGVQPREAVLRVLEQHRHPLDDARIT